MPPQASARPLRGRTFDHELSVTVSRVVGYAASCECGEPFPYRRSWDDALADARAHNLERHPFTPAEPGAQLAPPPPS